MGFLLSAPCLLLLCVTTTVIALPESIAGPANNSNISRGILSTFHQLVPRVAKGDFTVMVVCLSLPGLFLWTRRRQKSGKPMSLTSADNSFKSHAEKDDVEVTEAESTDPGLLKKHSEIKSYTTSRYTYPQIRVFFREHPQFEKLPKEPAPLPLLVFIHGLGGSVAQFNPLLTSLVNLASCLAIDLPGCGISGFEPTEWDAYKIEHMAELISIIIADYRVQNQAVVLIGHSLGCSLAALIASSTSTVAQKLQNQLSKHVIGLVAICPRAEPPTADEVAMFNKLLWIPSPIFDLWRRWDRRGGTESASVARFVGSDADEETKQLQYRFNDQSRTPVWRRMASGSLPEYKKEGVAVGGLPGRSVWVGIDMPVFLVAGEADHITKPEEIVKIASFLGKGSLEADVENEKYSSIVGKDSVRSDMDRQYSSAPVYPRPNLKVTTEPSNKKRRTIESLQVEDFLDSDVKVLDEPYEDPSTPNEMLVTVTPPQLPRPKKTLKTTILPKPASHAMLYQPAPVRILAGLISDFLSRDISPRLDLGWQLQYLSSSGKWDVKNLEKWRAVKPVSDPISSIFRAMKTLREVDPTHSPSIFVEDWSSQIKDIVDISHDAPVYDPRGLENGGIRYHKFPTVSKIPPTDPEVDEFINLIDKIRDSQKSRAESEGWDPETDVYIGVHCHYGFNRTGYFLVCYLKERCGYSIEAAIHEFVKKRPRGIKHAHFLDSLYVRYCKGLRRV